MKIRIVTSIVLLFACASAFGQTAIKIVTEQPGNLFYVGQTIELKVDGAQAPVTWDVKDLDGRVVASGSESGGTIKPDVKGMGIYYVACRTEDGKSSGKTSFGVVHKMPSLDRGDSPFGINGGALFHIGLRDIATEGKARLDLIQRLGVRWGRNDFWWGKIEPEFQKYDWRQADAAVEMYGSHGVDLMPIFCYSSAWSGGKSPDTEDEANRFGLYAGELVGRYKDKVHYWEVWNEPNLSQFWSPEPNPEDYARLLKAARRTTTANDPKAKLLGCVTAGVDTQFMRKVFEEGAGDAFDILSIHNYFWKDEDVHPDIKSIRDLFAEFGMAKPIWITEIGWPTGANWMTEQDQAKMLVRVFTLFLAEGIERIFYYNATDYQPYDSGGWDGRTGLFDEGAIPKAAAVAYNEMVWRLDGMKYGGKLHLGKDVYGRYFSRGNEQTAVVWTVAKTPVTIELPTDQPEVLVADMLGRERFVRSENGVLRLQVTDRPQYVKLRGTALYVLSAADVVPERLFNGMEQQVDVVLKGMAALRTQSVRLVAPASWKVTSSAAKPTQGDLGESIYRFKIAIPPTVPPGVYELAAVIKGVSDLRIAKGVEVATPAKLTLTPPSELKPGYTKLQVSVENRCDREVTGSVTVGIAGEMTSVPTQIRLKAGDIEAYRLNVPIPEDVGKGPLKITADMQLGISKVSDTIAVDPAPVKMVTNSIVIDGKLDDWQGVEPILVETGGAHVNQKGKWSGKADHSAKAWVSWDANGLYLAVDVTDDTNVWPGDESVWEADSLQLGIDAGNDAVTSGFDERNDLELEIGEIDGVDRIIGFVAPKGISLADAKIAIMAKPAGGAVYELVLPAKALGYDLLATGRLIGISFLVNDNDGQGRKSWVELTPGIGLGKDPTEYKDLWLVDR